MGVEVEYGPIGSVQRFIREKTMTNEGQDKIHALALSIESLASQLHTWQTNYEEVTDPPVMDLYVPITRIQSDAADIRKLSRRRR